MRELTINELDEVSGGDIGDAIKYWGAAAAVAQGVFGTGWASMAAVAALASPIGLTAILGLSAVGGYVLLK